jgi:hypothetical protein
MLATKEFYELLESFEKAVKGSLYLPSNFAKEGKGFWKIGVYYQDGHLNEAFKTYMHGYAFGKVIGRE